MSPLRTPLTGPVHAPDGLTSPAPAAEATRTEATSLPWLARAIQAAAPHARIDVWAKALEPHLIASGIDTPKRVAALLGQAAVEAGQALEKLAENTRYTTAALLCQVFPSRFPNLS